MHRNHFATIFAIPVLLLSISTSAQLSFQSLLTDTATHWIRQWNKPITTVDGGYIIGAISLYTDTAGDEHSKSVLAKLRLQPGKSL
ncbi:MAG TPA: hypothetical protein VE978_16320 [Chitinophagales bacterium]|nr:hypothetical protein [Chitinophagales bacterium]